MCTLRGSFAAPPRSALSASREEATEGRESINRSCPGLTGQNRPQIRPLPRPIRDWRGFAVNGKNVVRRRRRVPSLLSRRRIDFLAASTWFDTSLPYCIERRPNVAGEEEDAEPTRFSGILKLVARNFDWIRRGAALLGRRERDIRRLVDDREGDSTDAILQRNADRTERNGCGD